MTSRSRSTLSCTRHPGAAGRMAGAWLVETTLVAAGAATMVHIVLEAQEYYTDVLAGQSTWAAWPTR